MYKANNYQYIKFVRDFSSLSSRVAENELRQLLDNLSYFGTSQNEPKRNEATLVNNKE